MRGSQLNEGSKRLFLTCLTSASWVSVPSPDRTQVGSFGELYCIVLYKICRRHDFDGRPTPVRGVDGVRSRESPRGPRLPVLPHQERKSARRGRPRCPSEPERRRVVRPRHAATMSPPRSRTRRSPTAGRRTVRSRLSAVRLLTGPGGRRSTLHWRSIVRPYSSIALARSIRDSPPRSRRADRSPDDR